ncbi:GNAT family N-acetyltransferase [Amycolatopsis sp. NPDC051061]|uniref:GNAT family N-acetyltransferase n=1 Tax=Amycolatopsis sp. NPDC051061 TaxID=3155042 RepID=UPI003424C4F6
MGSFLTGLSLTSRYHRFFSGIRQITPGMVEAMTSAQLVLLALDGETVVGHVMAVLADDRAADIGVVVAEAYRRRGVGRRLVSDLSTALTAPGPARVRCDVLRDNKLVLDWLGRLLADGRFECDGETVTVHGTLTT